MKNQVEDILREGTRELGAKSRVLEESLKSKWGTTPPLTFSGITIIPSPEGGYRLVQSDDTKNLYPTPIEATFDALHDGTRPTWTDPGGVVRTDEAGPCHGGEFLLMRHTGHIQQTHIEALEHMCGICVDETASGTIRPSPGRRLTEDSVLCRQKFCQQRRLLYSIGVHCAANRQLSKNQPDVFLILEMTESCAQRTRR